MLKRQSSFLLTLLNKTTFINSHVYKIKPQWKIHTACNSSIKESGTGICQTQAFHSSPIWCEENQEGEEEVKKEIRDPTKDRSKVISVETSQRYIESEAYKTTYQNEPVYVKYRRNFKGQFAPKKTRSSCIKDDMIVTGNPCPICRDEFLVVDFRNVKLLKQFVSPYTDEVLPWSKTQVCQKQHRNIEVAIEKARIHGFLPFYVPFREYDYKDYYDGKIET